MSFLLRVHVDNFLVLLIPLILRCRHRALYEQTLSSFLNHLSCLAGFWKRGARLFGHLVQVTAAALLAKRTLCLRPRSRLAWPRRARPSSRLVCAWQGTALRAELHGYAVEVQRAKWVLRTRFSFTEGDKYVFV